MREVCVNIQGQWNTEDVVDNDRTKTGNDRHSDEEERERVGTRRGEDGECEETAGVMFQGKERTRQVSDGKGVERNRLPSG